MCKSIKIARRKIVGMKTAIPRMPMKRSCCSFVKNASAIYQQGDDGNDVLIVLRCPGRGELDLGFPAAGATGVHLCRVFHKMSKCKLCLRKVSIVNTATKYIPSTTKVSMQEIKSNLSLDKMLRKYGRSNSGTLILCGEDAVKAYEIIKGDEIWPCRIVKLCHMSQCGINHLTCDRERADDWRYVVIARYLDRAFTSARASFQCDSWLIRDSA